MSVNGRRRIAAGSVQIDANVRCLRIYPVESTRRSVSELQTVGLKLTRQQAVHLATVLLAAAQDWNEVDITAYRLEHPRKSDGTYRVTVTSAPDNEVPHPLPPAEGERG